MSTTPISIPESWQLISEVELLRREAIELTDGERHTDDRIIGYAQRDAYDQVLRLLRSRLGDVELAAVRAASPGLTTDDALLLLGGATADAA